jgi:hypothetical protein
MGVEYGIFTHVRKQNYKTIETIRMITMRMIVENTGFKIKVAKKLYI